MNAPASARERARLLWWGIDPAARPSAMGTLLARQRRQLNQAARPARNAAASPSPLLQKAT